MANKKILASNNGYGTEGVSSSLNCVVGKTIVKFVGSKGDTELFLHFSDNTVLRFYHERDCCEHVSIEEIVGDVNDLLYAPLLSMSEDSNRDHDRRDSGDSYTWTFYRMHTAAGHVTVRWLGESNGDYSESVDWQLLDETPEKYDYDDNGNYIGDDDDGDDGDPDYAEFLRSRKTTTSN